MGSQNGTAMHPGHGPHHSPEHSHGTKPIDPGYRLVVRTILWITAGLVLLAFVIWWTLT